MKLDVYENLLQINAGFDQAIRNIAALRKHGAFHRGALEASETDEAGRRFRERKAQERADEKGENCEL